MFRTCGLAAIVLGASAFAPSQDPSALVGTWRLVSHVDTPEGEAPIRTFGEEPIGLFLFTADGHASISIMRNRPLDDGPKDDVDSGSCVPDWYCAYFGTYRVDSARGQLITRVMGGNIPSFLGTEQVRSFVIDGDRLIFSANYEADGRRVHAERVLVRVTAEGQN